MSSCFSWAPHHALAAAALRAVEVALRPLRVAGAGDGDDDLLLRDEVLHRHVAVVGDELRAAVVAVLLDDLGQLVVDDLPLPLGGVEDRLQVGDAGLDLGQLVEDPLPLQGGQPAQLHVQDRGRLDLVDVEQLHQPAAGGVGRLAVADEGDDRVEVVEGLGVAAQDVRALLGLAQPVPGAPLDDLDLVVDVELDQLVEPQRPRDAVDDREHVAAERRLQLGVLVEVVQHDLGDGVAAQRDDQPAADAVAGLVGDLADALQAAVLDRLGDRLGQVVRVDLVRQLGADQLHPAAGVLLDGDDGAHAHRAATGPVGVLDALAADDQAVGREVRALDPLHARGEGFLGLGVGVLEHPEDGGRDLAQVVRRHVGGHADGDAGRAVDQQVGDAPRQDQRLLVLAVVVGLEVDGLLVDVGQHLHGQRREPGLGVPHGRGRVVARRAEVALAVDQRVAHRPGLGQPHEGVVDRGVAVRVVVTHHLTDDAGALDVAAVGAEALVVHREQHAAVHRLEAVADLGQGAADDDRHRVVDVAALHLLLEVDRLDAVAARGFGHGSDLHRSVHSGGQSRRSDARRVGGRE